MSDFPSLPGAVVAQEHPSLVVHYGDPLPEQRRLAEGRAIVDLADRSVIAVAGPDRLSWLDSVTSQSLAGLQPGESAETLLLDAQGRIEHAIHLIDDGETAWLIVETVEAEALTAWLERMRFLLRVEISRSDLRVVGTLGEVELPAARPSGVPLVWRDPWPTLAAGGHQYAEVAVHPGASWTWSEQLLEPEAIPALLERIRAGELVAAGATAAEALRIAAWRPRLGTEVDDRSIPHELDWMRSAVHLSKGCYRGQETIAKVHNLGHPPRRLVMLHLDGSDAMLPAPGDELFAEAAGDKPVGAITSAALHYELGPIALALVKRNTDPSVTLFAGEHRIAAAQEVVVPPTAGATAGVPRLKRLG